MEPRVAAQALPIAGRPIASRPRRDRSVLRHLSTVLLAVVLSAHVVAVVLAAATIRAVSGDAFDPTVLAILILTTSYAIVGWIIASRRCGCDADLSLHRQRWRGWAVDKPPVRAAR